MLKYLNFPGLRPLTALRELTQRASLIPRPPIAHSWWQGDSMPIPNNPTPDLGLSTSPRLYVSLQRRNLHGTRQCTGREPNSQPLHPLQSCLLSTVNMIILLLIHNNAYSYLLSCFF